MNDLGLLHFKIYAKDFRAAARLASEMDLHLSQWHWEELFVPKAFAEADGTTEEKRY